MKRPSREMAKYMRRHHWWWWGVLVLLAIVPVHIFLEHPIGASVVLGALVALGAFANVRHRRRRRELVESRAGESICAFARSFDRREVDTWVVRAVYEQLQEFIGGRPPVPIRATDKLGEDLCIDLEDLEMGLAIEIAQRTGRSLVATQANPYFGRISTVEDVVLFFNAQPRAA